MSLTIRNAFTQVRQTVQDVDEPYRHSDDKLFGYFNDALGDIRRLRPDLFIGSLDSTWVIYDDTNFDDPFPIDFTYFTTVIDYMASTVGIEDDEFANDGRAITLYQRFVTKLVGKLA
jgi:hypothetical protein